MMKSSDSSSKLFADEFNQMSDCHVEYSKQLGTCCRVPRIWLLARVGVGLVSGLDLNPREDELYMCMSYGW